MSYSEADYKKDKLRAAKARDRYARKRALELGVSYEKYLKLKKEKKEISKKNRIVKARKSSLKSIKEKEKIAKDIYDGKIKRSVVSIGICITIPYSNRDVNTDLLIDKIEKLYKDRRWGYYDGNEYGIAKVKHYKLYFVIDKKHEKYVRKIMSMTATILRRLKCVKGVTISSAQRYNDNTSTYKKISPSA